MSYFLKKTLLFSINCKRFNSKDEKLFKVKSIEIFKNLALINNMNK